MSMAKSTEKAGTDVDRLDMHRMCKTQEFKEATLNSVSYTLPKGGLPAMIWMYVVSVFGFGAAILSTAEMASIAPTSGGQYHWVSEFAPEGAQKILSYLIGWLCVLGWQSGVSFTVASQIQSLIVLNNPNYIPHFFARKLPLLEGLVLVLHICGFFAILITLWVFAPRTASADVCSNFSIANCWPSVGLACLVGITGPIYTLIGPDSAVHMAEEVRDASRILPWAMAWILLLNGTTSFVMVVTFAYCIGPLDIAIEAPYFFTFIETFYNATQSHAGATVMTCVITLLTLCSAISNVATASRRMFAFARDHRLPFAKYLSHVRPGWDVPFNAVMVSFCITALFSLINLGSTVTFNAILSIGVVSLLSSYLASIGCIMLKRLHDEALLPRRWSLGKWVLPLNAIGLAYVVIAYVFAFFPIARPVELETMN